MRYIRINDDNVVVCVREGTEIVDGEIQSEYGELGQIVQENGRFTNAPIDIDSIKRSKISELNKTCNQRIVSGFYSSAKDNVSKLYDFEIENQINLESLKNNAYLTKILNQEFTTEYYAKGGPCEVWTADEIISLYTDAMTFKTTCIKTYKLAKESIEAAESIDEVEKIVGDLTW